MYKCSDNSSNSDIVQESKNISFAVLSDPHYFAPELGCDQASYKAESKTETKLTAESKAIFEAFISNLASDKVSALIIPGDLTNNGEKINHLQMKAMLERIEQSGKKVFVIPGNHDINNPFSYQYSGSTKTRIDNISPDEFKEIYKEFGYSEAFSSDPASLSYAANLDERTILLGIDGSRYKEYTNKDAISSGKVSDAAKSWILNTLTAAKKSNKKVIAFMHFGLVEHFGGQIANPITANYILENYSEIRDLLADNGVKVVFTGHFHANDAVDGISSSSNHICDIETGSAITYPHSYRIVNLDYSKNLLSVDTKHIENVNYSTGGKSFSEYSIERTKNGLVNFFNYNWTKIPREYPDSLKNLLRTQFVEAVFAHYVGDEKISAEALAAAESLSNSSDMILKMIGVSIKSIYTDLAPSDNKFNVAF
jgi:3',5'-cyclic AMP phosphodiesterase CpdA